MLFVNEDIDDDLFRRAAEDYPLNTEQPDFDAFYKLINPGATTPARRKKRLYFLLLFLLPLFFIPVAKNNFSKRNTVTPGKNKSGSINLSVTMRGSGSEANAITSSRGNSAGISTVSFHPQRNSNANENPGTCNKQQKNIHFSAQAKIKIDIDGPTPVADREFAVSAENINGKNIQAPAATQGNYNNARDDSHFIETIKAKPQEADKQAAGMLKKSIAADTQNKTTKKQENKSRTAKFYAGLIGGPDFSAVKMQSVKKAGYNLGIIAGYRISKRFAVETGILTEKKYYRTAGKYFSRDKVNLPVYANIQYASGSCNMIEIPVNLHYTLSNKSRSTKFISAGVSSYFMKNEAYRYDLKYYNYSYSKSFKYDNKATTVSAVVNLSAGYTHRVGKTGDLLIESWAKLPVKKIGTGALPVQSAGIYIGFIKNIF